MSHLDRAKKLHHRAVAATEDDVTQAYYQSATLCAVIAVAEELRSLREALEIVAEVIYKK